MMSVIRGKRFVEILTKEDEIFYYRQLYNTINNVILTLDKVRVLALRVSKPLKQAQLNKKPMLQDAFSKWKQSKVSNKTP